jgi:hypothetical protein
MPGNFQVHVIRTTLIPGSFQSFQVFFILQIFYKPEVLQRFQKQFLKLDSKPKKPLLLWIFGNTLLSLSETTQLRYFIVFGRFIYLIIYLFII